MNKRDILYSVNFGQRVAEDESNTLSNYFVETDQWRRLYFGDVDIVYGAKGSGKTALYALLLACEEIMFQRSIILITAENPRGTPVFKDLVADPPTSEREFVGLWKLYFSALVSDVLEKHKIRSKAASALRDALEKEGLARKGRNLRSVLRAVIDYVSHAIRPDSIEAGLEIDPHTGLPKGFRGKITFEEPSSEVIAQGFQSIDQLFEYAESALSDAGLSVWILLDRLDVAFADSLELEHNALRALFRVYLDLLALTHVKLKIFLRTDIWKRITTSGFREASHITQYMTIRWDKQSLLNLLVSRIIKNQAMQKYYETTPAEVLATKKSQEAFFYRVFPKRIHRSRSFDWILARTQDGCGETTPRELIHLLNSLREQQARSLEIGDAEPDDEQIFSKEAFGEALSEVSRVRLEQTLFAEYPRLRKLLERLRGEYTLQTPLTLARIWNVSVVESINLANELIQVGFFEHRGSKESPEYWIPFLYRDALELVQGTASVKDAVRLTLREMELVRLLTRGMSNKEIAQELYISSHTVKTHIFNIYRKLGVSNRRALINYAIKIGLV